MQTGKSLQDLAKELERQQASKQDLVAPTSQLAMGYSDSKDEYSDGLSIHVGEDLRFGINSIGHEGLANRLNIPKKYYDRMKVEAPGLLADNVNTWFAQADNKRLVRTLDGNVRAFLSDRYRPIDNYDIAQVALPVLAEHGNIDVISTQVTERRMYIQVTTPRIQSEVTVGDVVQAGLVISNSEVGCGSVRIEPLLYRLVCLNGMIRAHSLKRHHVGKRIEANDVLLLEEFYTSETVQADNKAFMLKVRDTVRHAFDEVRFQEEIIRLRAAAENKIAPQAVQSSVEDVTKKFNITKTEGEGILGNLIEGGDLSQWGLANAVTAMANDDNVGYDRAVDFERIGGEIIDLSPKDWQEVATA